MQSSYVASEEFSKTKFILKIYGLDMIYTLTRIVKSDSRNQILQHKVLRNVLYINKKLSQIKKIIFRFPTIQLLALYLKLRQQ